MKFDDFIPPILYKIKTRLNKNQVPKHFAEIFSSYADALAACKGDGYEDTVLIDVVFEKTLRLIETVNLAKQSLTEATTQSLMVLLMAMHREVGNTLNVIDYGGACGAHYFFLRPLVPEKFTLQWAVVETPAMVMKAKSLETNELRFYTAVAKAKESLGRIDLVHSTGAIQYSPAPENSLNEMLGCAPAFVLFNRMALAEGEKIITIQESPLSANGPGSIPDIYEDKLCRYPLTYISKSFFEETISLKYNIKMMFDETLSYLDGKKIFLNGGYFAERCE